MSAAAKSLALMVGGPFEKRIDFGAGRAITVRTTPDGNVRLFISGAEGMCTVSIELSADEMDELAFQAQLAAMAATANEESKPC